MAFLVQALASLIVWLLVDDSVSAVWYNDDFYEWLELSGVFATLLTFLAWVSTKRGWVTVAVAVGCLLAVLSGVVVFGGYAVVNSA